MTVLAACGGGDDDVIDEGNALEWQFDEVTITAPNALDVVEFYVAESFGVSRRIQLEAARPLGIPPDVTVLSARVNLLRSTRPGRSVVAGYPGSLCTNRWPVPGFGPTYALEGLELYPGEVGAISFFIRATTPGAFTVKGVEVTYSDSGARRRQVSQAMTMRMIRDGSARPTCDPRLTSEWFGDEEANDVVVTEVP